MEVVVVGDLIPYCPGSSVHKDKMFYLFIYLFLFSLFGGSDFTQSNKSKYSDPWIDVHANG